MRIAHLSVSDALDSLRTSENGLSPAEAPRRLLEYGPNRIAELRGEAQWRQFLREFTHFFAPILWLAAALAFFAEWRSPGEGMRQLGAAIVAVVLINGSFSFWQEYRAERAIAALRDLLPQTVKVMRDGQLVTLAAEALVPGDLILLAEGDNVPADCRLTAGDGVRVNASTITGESLPKARAPESTGMHTEFGKIAHLTQSVEKSASHLQLEIARLSKLVAIFASGLGLVFFAIGTLIGLPFWANLMFAIGIIVANVPEGLLPTVTHALAMATQRMAWRNELVRHLPAVETLGATTVICSDKTGTLTENRMAVQQLFADGRFCQSATPGAGENLGQLLRNAGCCHNLKFGMQDAEQRWLSDPMELALAEFARARAQLPEVHRVGELAFDSDRRRMSVIVEYAGKRWLYCKGAPEVVMPLCTAVDRAGGVAGLDDVARGGFAAAQEAMADSGLRVLAFAWRRLTPDEAPRENELVLSGLIGLKDPPRAEVPEAVARCRQAGVKVIMVTGDHPHTALAIARDIGLVRGERPTVLLGSVLNCLIVDMPNGRRVD